MLQFLFILIIKTKNCATKHSSNKLFYILLMFLTHNNVLKGSLNKGL